MTNSSRPPGNPSQEERRAEARRTGASRDAGLRRVSRLTGWTVAAAIGLTGVLSEVAAHAFPGHSKRAATTAPARSRPTSTAPPADTTTAPPADSAAPAPEQSPPPDPKTSAPQPPPQVPAPSDATGGAVSGGS